MTALLKQALMHAYLVQCRAMQHLSSVHKVVEPHVAQVQPFLEHCPMLSWPGPFEPLAQHWLFASFVRVARLHGFCGGTLPIQWHVDPSNAQRVHGYRC